MGFPQAPPPLIYAFQIPAKFLYISSPVPWERERECQEDKKYDPVGDFCCCCLFLIEKDTLLKYFGSYKIHMLEIYI